MTREMQEIMTERFSKDSLIALATLDGAAPSVRAVNAYYEDGSFYVITHRLSGKMRQIEENPAVGICGDWFTGHGMGESLGFVGKEENAPIAQKLRAAFSAWIGNGHVDLNSKDTVILRITLTDGVLMSHGKRFEL